MLHNDVLRRLRYIFKLNDQKMLDIFQEVGVKLTTQKLYNIMKKEGEEGFVPCTDQQMAAFLDGFIIAKRGRQEGKAPQPWPANQPLGNNHILRSLRIALALKSDEVLAIMKKGGATLSSSELSAFSRRPGHRSYKICGDQLMRRFLAGLAATYRGDGD